jgi:mycoredoxin-dependent peroxiredoxin
LTPPVEGMLAPAVVLVSPAGPIAIPDPLGKSVVLMFYQEASTPACAAQITSLHAESALLDALGSMAVCVSTDDLERQASFADVLGVPRSLLAADCDGEAARAYGVYDESSGRSRRAAFVISGEGLIALAVPWYNPSNSGQLLAIFTALGLDVQQSEELAHG